MAAGAAGAGGVLGVVCGGAGLCCAGAGVDSGAGVCSGESFTLRSLGTVSRIRAGVSRGVEVERTNTRSVTRTPQRGRHAEPSQNRRKAFRCA